MSDNIAAFKPKEGTWNSHILLENIKENITPQSAVFILFLNEGGDLSWGTNGFTTESLVGSLEIAKFSLLMDGD